MTNNLSTVHTFGIGDKVVGRDIIVLPGQPRVENPYPKTAGATATVIESDGGVLSVKWDTDTGDHGRNWGAVWFEPAEVPTVAIGEGVDTTELTAPEAFGRPLVHFSDEKAGRDRSKARAYAGHAVSRILEDRDNEVLRAAADGESVDAYDLNRAVLAAMRSASTRLGQSSGRRVMATEFAHLGHIVQAVLENHADNLPGYAPGERSRALADLKTEVASALEEARREIEHAGSVNQALTQDLTAAREQRKHMASEARDLRSEIDALRSSEASAVQYGETARTNLAQTIREANEYEATLNYAVSLLSAEARAAVDGFQKGFAVGASDN